MRVLLGLGVCCVAAGCDPVKYASFAVAPDPTVGVDSAGQAAFAVAARVATRRGLTRFDPTGPDGRNAEGWKQCFTRSSLFLCGKVKDREVQFRFYQVRTFEFTPTADSLRRELLDSLRVEFGQQRVRECRWEAARDPRRSGCVPLAQRDSV